jgi:hypothetical protein
LANKFNPNPFTLFLILILLALSTDKYAADKLGLVRGIIDQTSRTVSTLREGILAMHQSFEHAQNLFINMDPTSDAGDIKN